MALRPHILPAARPPRLYAKVWLAHCSFNVGVPAYRSFSEGGKIPEDVLNS
jgi:hypothetical protein